MEPTPNSLEQMDAFLLGRMSEQEQLAFAARADQDPLLAQELRLQQDVVEGLRRARNLQLKARLNSIPPPPAGLSAWQVVGLTAATATLIAGGIAVYVAQSPDAEQNRQDSLRNMEQVYTPAPVATPVPEPAASEPADISKAATGSDGTPADAQALVEAKAESKDLAIQLSKGQKRVDMPTSGRVEARRNFEEARPLNPGQPDEEAEESGLISRPGIGTLPSGKVVENNEVKTKPEVVIAEADVLSYQYFDNRLFLYGSFGDAIYEVIELVTAAEGRRLFVFYKDKFYTVDRNVRSVTPMSPVTDPKLEGELTLLRKKKID